MKQFKILSEAQPNELNFIHYKSLLFTFFLLLSIHSQAQFASSGSYLGVMYSRGNLSALETFNQVGGTTLISGDPYANTTVSFSGVSFIGQLSQVGDEKLNFGGYFGWVLGGGTQKYHIDQIYSSYDQPQEDFEIYAVLKGGGQLTYLPENKDFFLGVRSYFIISVDGLRSLYDRSGSDEGLAFGLFGAYKRFNFDITYGPFIGKKEKLRFTQFELYYKSNITFGNNDTSLLFGTRYELSKVKNVEKTVTPFTILANGNANLFSLFVAIGI